MPLVPLSDLAAVLLALPRDLALEAAVVETGAVHVRLRTTVATVACPRCGVAATRVHSHHARHLADLACGVVPVRLRVDVRRFRCPTASCPRRLFAEQVPALALPRARRTQRAAARVVTIGRALGGEAGARLLAAEASAVSADTVLRAVRHAPRPAVPTPRVLGVDDWALRRGHTYGTLLVDLERRAPVDLLPDREAATLAAWLHAHPGVEVLTRDRAEVYAEGARRGAPGALQVADRWHLLKNVGDALERVLQQHRAALTAAAETPVVTVDPAVSSAPAPVATPPATAAIGGARGADREALYAQIHALRAAGASLHAIVAATGRSRATVRKYLRAASCPHRAPRRTKIGALTGFDAHLRARWSTGCDDARVLWAELVARGFRGTLRTVQRHVAAWPTTDPNRRRGRRRAAASQPGARPPAGRPRRGKRGGGSCCRPRGCKYHRSSTWTGS